MTYEQETLWLAGLMEGEGSFSPRTRKNRYINNAMVIQLSMTDEDVVRHAALVMGVPVKGPYRPKKSHHKTYWTISFGGDKAEEVCKRILPFMGQRRKASIEMLLEMSTRRMTKPQIAAMVNRRRQERKAKSLSLPFVVNE